MAFFYLSVKNSLKEKNKANDGAQNEFKKYKHNNFISAIYNSMHPKR